jgi:hypothetical protein
MMGLVINLGQIELTRDHIQRRSFVLLLLNLTYVEGGEGEWISEECHNTSSHS